MAIKTKPISNPNSSIALKDPQSCQDGHVALQRRNVGCDDPADLPEGATSDIHSFCLPQRMRLIATLSYEGQGPHLAAHTTHVEDKHNVLVGGVFTLVCDALVWLFDYTSNKWASTNVFLKVFETQTGEVRCVQLQWQWSVAGLQNSQAVSFNKLYRLRHT